jgi:hypothetical protein
MLGYSYNKPKTLVAKLHFYSCLFVGASFVILFPVYILIMVNPLFYNTLLKRKGIEKDR